MIQSAYVKAGNLKAIGNRFEVFDSEEVVLTDEWQRVVKGVSMPRGDRKSVV